MRYHYAAIKKAKIQNTDNTKCWQGCGNITYTHGVTNHLRVSGQRVGCPKRQIRITKPLPRLRGKKKQTSRMKKGSTTENVSRCLKDNINNVKPVHLKNQMK